MCLETNETITMASYQQPTFDMKAYKKEYRQLNSELINQDNRAYYKANAYDMARSKQLRRLNSQKTVAPKRATVIKYDLKYDTAMKVWY